MKRQETTILVLLIGFASYLVWTIFIWWALPNDKITLHFNLFHEKAFEFVLFHAISIWFLYLLVREAKDYYHNYTPKKENKVSK